MPACHDVRAPSVQKKLTSNALTPTKCQFRSFYIHRSDSRELFPEWSEKVAKLSIIEILQRNVEGNARFDILLFNSHELRRLECGKTKIFNAAGHFPILAGYDKSCRPLFCAESSCISSGRFGLIIDESSNVVLQDSRGEMHTVDDFYVHVLRYDPSDWEPLLESSTGISGTIDPTGPLHWRKLWPVEDPYIQRLTKDTVYCNLKTKVKPFLDECAQEASRNISDKHSDDCPRTRMSLTLF